MDDVNDNRKKYRISNPRKGAAALSILAGLAAILASVICLILKRDILATEFSSANACLAAFLLIVIFFGLFKAISGTWMLMFFHGAFDPAGLARDQVESKFNSGRSFRYGADTLKAFLVNNCLETGLNEGNLLASQFITKFLPGYLFLPSEIKEQGAALASNALFLPLSIATAGVALLGACFSNCTMMAISYVSLLMLLFISFKSSRLGGSASIPGATFYAVILLGTLVVAIFVPSILDKLVAAGYHPPTFTEAVVLLLTAYLAMALSICLCALTIFLRAKHQAVSSASAERRENIVGNAQPADLLRRVAFFINTVREIKMQNRVYSLAEPKLQMEGGLPRGGFKGETLIETPPVSVEAPFGKAYKLLVESVFAFSVGLMFFMAIWLLGVALLLKPEPLSLEFLVECLMPLLLISQAGFMKRFISPFLSETMFKSSLALVSIEGSYVENTLDVGAPLTSQLRTRTGVNRCNFICNVFASEITSSTFAGSGMNALSHERFIIESSPNDFLVEKLFEQISGYIAETERTQGPSDISKVLSINRALENGLTPPVPLSSNGLSNMAPDKALEPGA